MKRNKYLHLSIGLSLISIAITLFISYQIASAFINADGKTKALFELIELGEFGYQYYVALIGITAFILSLLKVNTDIRKKRIAIILSILAIAIVFVRIWRLFI